MLGQDLSPVQISDFFAAERRLRQSFPPSPLLSMAPLDQQLGAPVYLKAESLLPSGAYKIRGATNKIMTLAQEVGSSLRIITASSGNHGMACALSAKRLGIPATIVVPEPTPEIKKSSIRAMGADLLEIGATYDETFAATVALAEEKGMYYVHPTSDRYTVAGQGTISLELLQQLPDVDQIVVPIGGGGLITGISYAMKHLKPGVRIVGVMPEGSAVYAASRAAGKLVTLDSCASIADAVVRLIPGAIGDEQSALSDSFQDNLLAPPVYTRPAEYRGWRVPDVLLSGNQAKIDEWKHNQSIERTMRLRPDLLADD